MNRIFKLPVPAAVLAQRKPGYEEELRRVGKLSPDGTMVQLTPEQFADIRIRFAKPRVHRIQRGLRLGDKFAKIAKPIARGIDKVFGTNLVNCHGCAKRQKRWNQITL